MTSTHACTATWTLSGFGDEIAADFSEQCTVLLALGISRIEVRSAWNVNVVDFTEEQLKRLADMLAEYRIEVSSIGSPIGKTSILEDFAPELSRFHRVLDVARRLRAPYVRVFSFYVPDDGQPERYRSEVLRRLALMAGLAGARGVVLVVENEAGLYGDVPERCLDIAASVASPNLRLAWDGGNFVRLGIRPFTDGYQLLKDHIGYVQVKDVALSAGGNCLPGQGDAQWPDVLRALHSDGYRGYFSMEPHLLRGGQFGGFSGPGPFGRATRAFQAMLTTLGIEYG